jgi:hypothetical protein
MLRLVADEMPALARMKEAMKYRQIVEPTEEAHYARR